MNKNSSTKYMIFTSVYKFKIKNKIIFTRLSTSSS